MNGNSNTLPAIALALGIGRRINEQVSVFARIGYEESDGEVASRLAQDQANRDKLLSELRGKPASERSAKFVTSVALVIEGSEVTA